MKRTIFTLCILQHSFFAAFAQITDGNALKINSCYTGNKALFMQNATLGNEVDVIAWTETNVPAQRWTVSDAGDGLFFLTNAYSGRPLSNSSTRPNAGNKIILKSNNSEHSKWRFVPVANTAYPNAYYIVFSKQAQDNSHLYLEFDDNSDGSQLKLQFKREDADSLRQMWTVVAEDILPNRVTPALRDSVMRGWKARYFNWLKSETTGFWGEAEMLETILDGYETTGKQEYRTMFEEAYAHFVSGNGGWGVKGNGKDWRWNEYNDDIAWAVLASVRAFLMFGQHPNSSINYLTIAKNNYDWMYARALLPGGTLRWKQSPAGNRGSNSCINGPAEVAACYLGIATGEESYFEKAKNLYAKQRQVLYDPNTGKVFDSGSWNEAGTAFTVGNGWVSTYNQGTFLGAALMLYNHYGTAQYKNDAHKIVEWTRNDLCNSQGVVRVCGSGDDLQGFKGILMRYLRRYVVDLAVPEKVEWLQRNALQAYNNRNSQGIIWTAWWEKSAENFVFSDGYNFANKPFGSSTAVSAAFNAPLSADLIIKNAFETIEAEHFDYLKGVFVERTNDETAAVTNTGDGYFTSYSNVDFGSVPATGIRFTAKNSSRSNAHIEVRCDSIDGQLLATADIAPANEWNTVSCPIENLSGRHNIFLVYRDNGITIDSFCFTNDETGNLENPGFSAQLKLYPNPVVDDLKIDCPRAGRLCVYDSLGKKTATATVGNGIATLNVSNYNSGVYFVNLIAKDENYFAKFLKK
jgi:predicted alpha-1,6-mannanase (GH76 family)